MNVLRKCCYRSLKENKRRTAVTLVGIILATSLLTAVACMAVSFRVSMVAYEKQQTGDWHYLFQGVRAGDLKYFRNNENVERMGLTQEVGYGLLEGSQNPDKPYLYLRATDQEGQKAMALKLVEGRMPENARELAVARHVTSNGLVDIQVGDELTLQVGGRLSDGVLMNQGNPYLCEEESFIPYDEKKYTVVGILERPNEVVESRWAPGYSAFTCLEELEEDGILDVYATYTHWGLRHQEQVTAGILGVSQELYQRYNTGQIQTLEEKDQVLSLARAVNSNYWMMKWELFNFSSGVMNMLYTLSALAAFVIVTSSVFCIRNSFDISLMEKMKLYGRLASVGTTSRQQRKIVYYEAAFFGAAGIPLGTACGIGATWILVWVVGGLVEEAVNIRLVFGISVPAVLLALVLSSLTIYLSASKSARKAARLSPISAIRSNDTVKMGKRGLGCPRLVERFLGVGGRIAYKNMKRARVKYRTTVASIVISVATFIGMTTFVQLMSTASEVYYSDMRYQMRVSSVDSDAYEKGLQIAGLDGAQEVEIVRQAMVEVDGALIPYTEEYLDLGGEREERVIALSLGQEAYARYLEQIGFTPQEAEGKAIVIANYRYDYQEDGKWYLQEGNVAVYHPGEVIRGIGEDSDLEIQVLAQTTVRPFSQSGRYYDGIMIIVSDRWMDSRPERSRNNNTEIYIKCLDADKMEETVRSEMDFMNYSITNYDAAYRADRSLHLVVGVFLYGFITVVALIGITNIFNTVTTNIELRAPEFAMLKSVGMTRKEFRRMVWLEGVFYGGKALAIGIPLGLLFSLGFHRALGEGLVTAFRFPWEGILSSAVAVALLLYGILHYSMSRIGRKNIMDTIRNENI